MTHQKPKSFLLNRYRLFILTVGIFAALTVGFYVFVYTQLHVIQVLLVPALIIVLVVLFAPLVIISLNRGRPHLSGILILVGLALAYSGNELVWKDLTVYHLIGGILLLILAGNLVLPSRFGYWLFIGLFYLFLILKIDSLPDLARINSSIFPIMLPFSLVANIMLFLAILVQMFVEFQARSIRARLLGTFLLLVVLPVGTIGVITSLLTASINTQQVYRQFDSVVSLKTFQLTSWLDTLQKSLDSITSNRTNVELIDNFVGQKNADPDMVDAALNAIVASGVGFREVFLLDPAGRIVLSTEEKRIGAEEQSSPYMNSALTGPTFSPVYYSETFGENVIVIAMPVQDETGRTIAVIAGRVDQNRLINVFSQRSGLGESGESYLVTSQGRLLAPSRFAGYSIGQKISSTAIDQVIRRGLEGQTLIITGGYVSYHNSLVLGYYRWSPELQVAAITEQSQSEALAPTYRLVVIIFLVSLFSIIIAFLVGIYATRRIVQPLASLSRTAAQIAAGDLSLSAEKSELIEINSLAQAFNSMTGQLRSLVADLERQVLQRTQDLERRSQQLQIAADVAREATAIRDFDELINRTVYLIRERFGYYHVGLFLLDDRKQFAVLVAATGDAGKRLLERNHRLKIGETSMVGYVSHTGVARVAADVTKDSTHYDNPDLPDTRAEGALPLRAGRQVIGVLDVQSTREGAFSEDVLEVLQIVADQFAVAIESARLLRQTQATLHELQVVSRTYTRDAWQTAKQRLGGLLGYRYRGLRAEPIDETVRETSKLAQKQVIPLRLRDSIIGELELYFEEPPEHDALLVFNDLGERLALLLENARLVQEAQNLAAREQRINVISSKVRSSLDLDAILRSTVQELGAAFGASRTFVQLNPAYRLAGIEVEGNGGPDNKMADDHIEHIETPQSDDKISDSGNSVADNDIEKDRGV